MLGYADSSGGMTEGIAGRCGLLIGSGRRR